MRVLFRAIPSILVLLLFALGSAPRARAVETTATDQVASLESHAAPNPHSDAVTGEDPPSGSEDDGLPTDVEYVIEQFLKKVLDLLGSGF